MSRQIIAMMASLRVNRQQTQIYAKNSMDRFGDKLYEHILSYLSLEDRFRCECVSKQFQRTVFESVVVFTITDRLFKGIERYIKEILVKIAKKCPKIQTIDCRRMELIHKHIPEVLRNLRHNCPNLRDIYCSVRENDHWIQEFGPYITRIEKFSALKISDMKRNCDSFIHCNRLTHLEDVFQLSHIFNTSGQLMAKNLQKLTLSFYFDRDYDRLSAFVAHNQCLKGLEMNGVGNELCTLVTDHLCRLPQLRRLKILLEIKPIEHSLNESLRTIGAKCPQLRRLSLTVMSFAKVSNVRALDLLRCFPRLKRLDLCLFVDIDQQLLEPLKLCQRLTHLEIYLCQMPLRPNIQHRYNKINIKRFVRTSRLPALQTLVIQCNVSIDLSDNDFNYLLYRSPKLKSIEIRVNNEKMFYYK